MIRFDQVNKTYHKAGRKIAALCRVNLHVRRGEFLVVKGPSGCGKTTLLLSAGGLLHPDEGSVSIDGEDLYFQKPEQRAVFRATRIGFVFQQYHLIPYLTVLENILVSTLPHRRPVPASTGEAMTLLATLGLEERAGHIPAELSAGEKQRTALARALLCRPPILLADEITGNLDLENSRMVLDRLKQFSRAGGTLLLVTHDEKADPLADRTLLMAQGEIR